MVEKALLEGHRSPSGMGMHLSCLCEQTQNFFADENAQKKYFQQGSSEESFFTRATSRLRDFGMQLGDFFPIGKSVEVGSTPGQTPLKL